MSWATDKAREIVRRHWSGEWSGNPELELEILEVPFAGAISEAIEEAARRCDARAEQSRIDGFWHQMDAELRCAHSIRAMLKDEAVSSTGSVDNAASTKE